MVGQDGASDPFGPGTTDVQALRRQHREARAVLDHQIAALQEIDNAALRTSQLSVVTLALVLSVARLSGAMVLSNVYVQGGSFGLVSTLALGLFTHGTSNVDLGPNPEYVADLQSRPYSEREWLFFLLERYTEWIRTNQGVIHRNGLYLQATQFVLLLSVGALTLGTALTVVPDLAVPLWLLLPYP